MTEVVLTTVEDTEAFGATLAAELRAGDVVILDGPLGAGKTAMTRGIAAGLGVRGPITSPTFVIARVHPPVSGSGPTLVHVDAYRLLGDGDRVTASALDELDALDLDAELHDSVVVIEWGEGLADVLADRTLHIALHRDPLTDARTARYHWRQVT